MWLRSLTIWLGAALLGSILGWVGLQLFRPVFHLFPQPDDVEMLFGQILMPFIFTVFGSALLALAFGVIDRLHVAAPWKYLVLLVIGTVAGGLMLSWGGAPFFLLGAAYGALTTVAWVALLVALRMHRAVEVPDHRAEKP